MFLQFGIPKKQRQSNKLNLNGILVKLLLNNLTAFINKMQKIGILFLNTK